jgi:hypothetical protein
MSGLANVLKRGSGGSGTLGGGDGSGYAPTLYQYGVVGSASSRRGSQAALPADAAVLSSPLSRNEDALGGDTPPHMLNLTPVIGMS